MAARSGLARAGGRGTGCIGSSASAAGISTAATQVTCLLTIPPRFPPQSQAAGLTVAFQNPNLGVTLFAPTGELWRSKLVYHTVTTLPAQHLAQPCTAPASRACLQHCLLLTSTLLYCPVPLPSARPSCVLTPLLSSPPPAPQRPPGSAFTATAPSCPRRRLTWPSTAPLTS